MQEKRYTALLNKVVMIKFTILPGFTVTCSHGNPFVSSAIIKADLIGLEII